MEQIPKLDLHLHSPYSDGSTPIGEMISECRLPFDNRNLKMIALTDHNTLNGIEEFKRVLNDFNKTTDEPLSGIAGIEISASYKVKEQDQEIHILGYFSLNADFNEKRFDLLQRLISEYKRSKNKQLEMILENIIQDGYSQLSLDEFYEFASTISADGNLNRPSIARYLQKKGLVDSVAEAFDRFIGKDCKYFLELGKPTCEEVIRAINEAKGISVIAHLGEYPFDKNQREEFFDFCTENRIGGYELFHPHNTEEIICAILAEEQKHKDLILTQGSDYHGLKVKPNNHLGETVHEELRRKFQDDFDRVSREAYDRLKKL